MKIYNKLVLDENFNVIEEDSFEYNGEIAECGASLAYFIVYIVITLITTYMTYRAMQAAMDDFSTESQGIKANTKTTREPLRIIYGTARVGGNDVWGHTGAKHHNWLYLAMTVSEGEIEGIKRRESDNKPLWYLDGKLYNNFKNVKITEFYGTANQTSHSKFTSANGANFTDTMENTAWLAYELKWDEDKFRGIPKRETIIEGLKILDVRVPSAAKAFSDNPANVLYDFLTSKRYGIGLDSDELDTTTFAAAANYCDNKGWGCNMVITRSDKTAWSIVEEILATFRGQITYFNNKYYLKIPDLNEESSVMTLDDEHIVQQEDGKAVISIAQPGRFSAPTGIRVSFIDSEKDYSEDYIMIGEEDGVVEDFPLLGVNNRKQAADLGYYQLERMILNRTITGTFRDDALLLEPMDVVTLNSTALGISDQLMRVSETSLTQNGLINLTLKYESYQLYDDDFDVDVEQVYDVDLPDPSLPSVIYNLNLTEETKTYRLRTFTRLNINFEVDEDDPWYQYCEVWTYVASAGFRIPEYWEYKMQFTTQDSTYIDNVSEGYTYYVRLRTVNKFGTKQDLEEATMVYRTIDGALPVPPPSLPYLQAVPGDHTLLLTSEKLSESDVEMYEFRLGESWDGAIFVSAKRSPQEFLTNVKSGTWTFWCNTKGYNGLYGETPRYASVVIPEPQNFDLYQEFTSQYDSGNASVNNLASSAFVDFDNLIEDFTVGSGEGLLVAVVLENVNPNKDVASITWDYGSLNQSLTYLTSVDPVHNDVALELWYINEPTAKTGDIRVLLDSPGQAHIAFAVTYYGSIYDATESPDYSSQTSYRTNTVGDRIRFDYDDSTENSDIAFLLAGFDATSITLVPSTGSADVTKLDQEENSPFTGAVFYNDIPASGTTIAWEEQGGTPADNSSLGVWIHARDNEFQNTEQINYVGSYWLKSSHSSAYTPETSGYFVSRTFETNYATPRWYRVYTEEDIIVVGGGTTWTSLLDPSGANRTWEEVNVETRTWREMFEIEEAPKVFMEIWYKENSGDPWQIITNAQISEAMVYGKYFKVRIAIEDPATNINAYVSDFRLELYRQST